MPSSQGPATAAGAPRICAATIKPPKIICFFMRRLALGFDEGLSSPTIFAAPLQNSRRSAARMSEWGWRHQQNWLVISRRLMRSRTGNDLLLRSFGAGRAGED